MSRQAPSEPGGSRQTDSEKAVKVPQVHGKRSESIEELIDEWIEMDYEEKKSSV
jgi:hypothetical protein